MNPDSHIAKWNGQHIAQYGGECVANAATYCLENGKPIAFANAVDWWQHPALTGAFNFIANNPNDPNQLPARGDIVIWNGSTPGSQGFGHIGIYLNSNGPGSFTGFDQNWGGNYCHFVTHNWNWIIGWMTPKGAAPVPQGDEMIANQDQARDAYALLRGSRDALSQDELNSTAGHRTWAGFAVDARPEIAAREANKQAANQSLQNLQNTINHQNEVIANVTSDSNATKVQLQQALDQIAKDNADLATAHDQIKDLQNQPPVTIPTTQPPVVENPLFSLIRRIIKAITGGK